MTYLQKHKLIICVLVIIVTIETLVLCFGKPEPVNAKDVRCNCTCQTVTQEITLPEPTDPPVKVEVQKVGTLPNPEPVIVPERINCPLDDETQQMILDQCEEYGIDFAFTMAVIFKESSFRPHVISYNGTSVGLMQINKINHKWLSEELGITDFFDPAQNVKAGLYMLSDLFEKYEDPAKVLMCYNLGESGAKKLWNQGVYSTAYSEGVLQKADEYKKEITERMVKRDQM